MLRTSSGRGLQALDRSAVAARRRRRRHRRRDRPGRGRTALFEGGNAELHFLVNCQEAQVHPPSLDLRPGEAGAQRDIGYRKAVTDPSYPACHPLPSKAGRPPTESTERAHARNNANAARLLVFVISVKRICCCAMGSRFFRCSLGANGGQCFACRKKVCPSQPSDGLSKRLKPMKLLRSRLHGL